jgi:hypothetical protein
VPWWEASVINNRPGVGFDGVDDFLLFSSNLLTGTSGSVVAVLKPHVVSGTQYILGSSDEATATRYCGVKLNGTNAGIAQCNNDVEDNVKGNTTLVADAGCIVSFQSDDSAYYIWVNGLLQTLTVVNGANSGDWFSDATAKDNVTLGALKYSAENLFLNGYILEVLIYPKALSDSQRRKVERYLSGKYGVAVV